MQTRKNEHRIKRTNEINQNENKMKRRQRQKIRIKIILFRKKRSFSHQCERLKIFDENRNRKILKQLRTKIKQLKTIVESQFRIVKLCAFELNDHTLRQSNEKQLNFENKIQISHNEKETNIMTNTNFSISNFVNRKTIKKFKLSIIILIKSIKLRLTNDKLTSNIIYMIQMKFNLKHHVTKI